MIGRMWKGWATTENAAAYEELFRGRILPELRDIEGFVGAYVMMRGVPKGEAEITTITLFESMGAIRAFAGEYPSRAHVTSEARRLLSRFEDTVVHYDVVVAPQTD